MRVGWAVGCASGLVTVLALAAPARAAEVSGSEVRVLSGPGATSAVTVRAEPGVQIEDRTTGARPATAGQGPASLGETFSGEISIFLRSFTVSRAAQVDVGDAVVSTVRLFPEADGTTVTIFVRQPVTYTVARPSAIGEVRIEVRSRIPAPTIVTTGRKGTQRIQRPKPPGTGEVAVDAESLSYDEQSDTLTARGGVTLTRGDTTLTADEVVYDRTNSVAEAKGHVVVRDPQATLEGDFAHLNLDDESGWVDSATADLEPSGFVVRGGRIIKKGGPRYAVEDGIFTTCQCGGLERPSWSMKGHHTDVTLQGSGVVRGLTFRVKDVPVLWFPYFIFPANTERQSGFLMPRVGYSNRRGFQYEQAFYWAIDKSSDATVAIDVEQKARVGFLGEYRYRLSPTAHGEFAAAYYNEQIRGQAKGTVETGGTPADVPENRFLVAGHHFQPALGDSKFYLDMLAVSDDLLLREINNFTFSGAQSLQLRTLRFTTSRTGLFKTWGEGLAWGETAYYQDLIDPQSLALQKLPRIEAEHSVPLLGDRLVGRVAGEAVDYQREDGFAGLRGDLAPELSLPFNLGRALFGSVTGRLSETVYHLTDTEQVAFVVPNADVAPPSDFERFRKAPELPALDTNRTRELAEVQARTGTAFERVYDFRHFGYEKMKHTIEPEVQYLFVPQVGRPIFDFPLRRCDTLPLRQRRPGDNCDATLFSEGYLFDERDAINRRNFISYGITTRLLGRAPTADEAAARAAAATAPEPPLPQPEPAAEGPPETGEGADGRQPVDPEVLSSGVPADAIPSFVGPPAPTRKGAPPPAPRELLRATILQGYDISRPLVGDSHLSDVDIGLRFTPLDYLGLSYNTTVSLEDSAVRGMSVGLVLREPWWTPTRLARYQSATTVGIAYRFVENNVNRLQPGSPESLLLATSGVNEIDGSMYLRLGNNLGFTFLSRYTLSDSMVAGSVPGTTETLGPHFLERDYLLRLISSCNCWILEAGVTDTTNPDERLFRVQLTLVGLGSFGQRPAGSSGFIGLAPLSNLGLRPIERPKAGGLY